MILTGNTYRKHTGNIATQLREMLQLRMTKEPLGMTDGRHHGNEVEPQLLRVCNQFTHLLGGIALFIGRIRITCRLNTVLKIHHNRIQTRFGSHVEERFDGLHRLDLARKIDLRSTNIKLHNKPSRRIFCF